MVHVTLQQQGGEGEKKEEREERNHPRTVNLVSAFNTCREEVMRRDEREGGALLGDRAYILNFNQSSGEREGERER